MNIQPNERSDWRSLFIAPFWVLFFFFNVYFRERAGAHARASMCTHVHMEAGKRQKERERERIPSRLLNVSLEPDTELDLMTVRS